MKEEYINALQNIGAVLFVIGFIGNLMVDTLLAYIPCLICEVVGVVLIFVAESIVMKEYNKKIKDLRTAKHQVL